MFRFKHYSKNFSVLLGNNIDYGPLKMFAKFRFSTVTYSKFLFEIKAKGYTTGQT